MAVPPPPPLQQTLKVAPSMPLPLERSDSQNAHAGPRLTLQISYQQSQALYYYVSQHSTVFLQSEVAS